MKRIAILLIAFAILASLPVLNTRASRKPDAEAAPIYGIKIPAGYRDWTLVSVARVGGQLNDIRAKLGNDVAIKAYREGKMPFPDGAIIARLAWKQTTSDENNKAVRTISEKGSTSEVVQSLLAQSFIAGPQTNVQFMVKDSKKYPSRGGWGFAQFTNGSSTARQCTRPASPAMSPRSIATLSSPVTHPDIEGNNGPLDLKLELRITEGEIVMKRITVLLITVAVAASVIAFSARAFRPATQADAPVFITEMPADYREWRFISVAHEEANLNSFASVLGNDIAIKAYREGTLPFPDGAIIAALHYKFVPSAENNKAFGRDQSFVAGAPTNVQFMVKDFKKYAATGGWGFGHFNNDGKPVADAFMKTCFPCHQKIKERDLVFTRYAP